MHATRVFARRNDVTATQYLALEFTAPREGSRFYMKPGVTMAYVSGRIEKHGVCAVHFREMPARVDKLLVGMEVKAVWPFRGPNGTVVLVCVGDGRRDT